MRTIIIDGNSTLWRIARSMPALTNPDGERVEVLYGFLKTVRLALEKFEPDNALVAWDEGIPKLRVHIFDGYKKHRREKKQEKIEERDDDYINVMGQLDRLHPILRYLAIAQVGVKNMEADDIISVACQCLEGKRIVISADHDMLQLVRKGVDVYFPLAKKPFLYTRHNFEKAVGLTPRQFVEVKALIGDGSDEIPGIAKGFGKGAATELIRKFGNFKGIEENTREIQKTMSKRHALVCSEEANEAFHRNMQLVDLSIVQSHTLEKHIKRALRKLEKIDQLLVRSYFREQKFASLLDNFPVWIRPFTELNR